MLRIQATARFDRLLKIFVKRHPELRNVALGAMESLARNPHAQKNKTHTLHGALSGTYAASLTYSYRIVFELSDDAIIFLSIGSHDDVYRV